MIALIRSESTKLLSATATWVLALVTVFGTLPMAWTNSASSTDLPTDSDLLFSSAPIPLEYQGFEMAGLGYVMIVALAALWSGSEYGSGRQIRTTLLATPKRLRVFAVKAVLLAVVVSLIAFVTMTGSIIITHIAARTGIDPWTLTPAIWAHLGGVALAWTLTALIAFAVGTLARNAILPLILIVPLVIGVGDFLAGFWSGARFLPTTAGSAMYADPASGTLLDPAMGALVQTGWTVVVLAAAGVVFTRRDL
ncbi:hypothetical protein ACIQTT_08275 [Microbacterium sp. NPDC090225]|uniref:hypothetical protein n=1 Tax=Microbacterium sp. NPDC090225 TaxID=3364207 RepID=UPI0038093943